MPAVTSFLHPALSGMHPSYGERKETLRLVGLRSLGKISDQALALKDPDLAEHFHVIETFLK